MGVIKFWSDMVKRPHDQLQATDKLLVGKQDQSDIQYTDLDDVNKYLAKNVLRKNGYRWIKGDGNEDLENWEVNDEFIGEGDFFPGYKVHGFIKNAALNDYETDTTILNSTPV